jgi:SAM-dependent methyltransferase
VVDVGAGTGQLTRVLAGRFARVIAVEPLAPQRALLAANVPGVEVRAGTAERMGLPDRSARAVFVAEAFHWFDGRRALTEAARVLAPPGGIALLWNIPAAPWQPSLPDRARRLTSDAFARAGEPGGPKQARGTWREAFAGSPFGPLHSEHAEHAVELDRDGLVANVMSVSSIAALPPVEREAIRAALTEAVPAGTYRRRLRTEVYWARLAAGGDVTARP